MYVLCIESYRHIHTAQCEAYIVRLMCVCIHVIKFSLCLRRIGPRSHVWCEKEMVDKAAWEFEEVNTVCMYIHRQYTTGTGMSSPSELLISTLHVINTPLMIHRQCIYHGNELSVIEYNTN